MSPIEKLKDLKILSWSTILFGLKKGWANRGDAINYAVCLLVEGSEDLDVALIAGGETLSDDELFELISNQIKSTDDTTDIDKWRLAHLLCIAKSEDCEQSKLDKLQMAYADFGYPEDMASCSIYSQHGIDPLVAMIRVIDNLRNRLTSR